MVNGPGELSVYVEPLWLFHENEAPAGLVKEFPFVPYHGNAEGKLPEAVELIVTVPVPPTGVIVTFVPATILATAPAPPVEFHVDPSQA